MQTQVIVETWRQEAIQEGVKQGIQEGECAVLLRQLRQRFGDAVDAPVEQRIATASIEQIDLWTVRILSAATLAEVFRQLNRRWLRSLAARPRRRGVA